MPKKGQFVHFVDVNFDDDLVHYQLRVVRRERREYVGKRCTLIERLVTFCKKSLHFFLLEFITLFYATQVIVLHNTLHTKRANSIKIRYLFSIANYLCGVVTKF